MRGFPKFINSKQDVYNLLPDYPVETKAFLQGLLESKDNWFYVAETTIDGINDDTHKVVENKATDSEEVTYAQYELREDENAYIFRLGFTVAEVQELLK